MNIPTALPRILPLALLLSACASAPKPASPEPKQPSEKPAVLAVAAPSAAELAPIPDKAPADMLLLGRIANLRMAWANADRLLLANGGAPIPVQAETLLVGLIGPTLADIVDLGGPVDAAVAGSPPDQFVISFAVDPEVAPRLGKMLRLRPEHGMLRVLGSAEEDGPWGTMLGACALTNPEEDVVQRLVCATEETRLGDVGGYLGRKVAREPSEGDVRMEAYPGEVLEALLTDPGTPSASQAEAMGEAMSKSFLSDIGKLGFVASWGKNEIDAELGLGLRSQTSPLSSLFAARAAPSSRPPEVFWRLPKDAAFSMYGNVEDAGALKPLRDEFLRALSVDMAGEGYDHDLMEEFGRRVSSLYFTGGPMAVAFGVDRSGAEKAVGEYFAKTSERMAKGGKLGNKPDRTELLLREKAYKSVRSWMVMGVEEPPEVWTRGIKGIVETGNAVDAKRNGGVKPTSKAPKAELPKDGPDRDTTTIAIVPPSALAPKGSLHVEVRTRPLVESAPPLHIGHFYVVPDGARTWMGYGEDEGDVLRRLATAREGLPEKTNASIPELELVRAPGMTSGGFLTVAGFTQLWADADRDSALQSLGETLRDLSTLPARGETIVPWTLSVQEDAGAQRRVRLRSRLFVSTLVDLIALAKK